MKKTGGPKRSGEDKNLHRKTNLHIKIMIFLVFLLMFLLLNSVVHLQLLNTKSQEKLKVTYTAETTIRRIESLIDTYISKTDMLKNMIASGYDIGDDDFQSLGGFLLDGDSVIDAVELAKNGVVNMVYPKEENEAALGLDMLNDPARKREGFFAKESGKYTLADPFELKQGGFGALLFDPIYIDGDGDEKEFWGFSLLVVDWDRFKPGSGDGAH